MAETSGLLNRRTGDSRTEGSNPSVSAMFQTAEAIALEKERFPTQRIFTGATMLDGLVVREQFIAYLGPRT